MTWRRPWPRCGTPAPSSSGRTRPSPPATTRPEPTTSFRPAALARSCGALSTESYGKFHPGSADQPRRPGRRPRRGRGDLRRRGSDGPTRSGRAALRGRSGRRMSRAPSRLPTYAWEPTRTSSRRKYGLPREAIVRFDVNTSAVATGPARCSGRVVRSAAVRVPAERLRVAGCGGRRGV